MKQEIHSIRKDNIFIWKNVWLCIRYRIYFVQVVFFFLRNHIQRMIILFWYILKKFVGSVFFTNTWETAVTPFREGEECGYSREDKLLHLFNGTTRFPFARIDSPARGTTIEKWILLKYEYIYSYLLYQDIFRSISKITIFEIAFAKALRNARYLSRIRNKIFDITILLVISWIEREGFQNNVERVSVIVSPSNRFVGESSAWRFPKEIRLPQSRSGAALRPGDRRAIIDGGDRGTHRPEEFANSQIPELPNFSGREEGEAKRNR